MAKRKIVTASEISQDDTLVDISQVGSQASEFWAKYGKNILYVGGALFALIAGYLAYKYLYVAPKQKQAIVDMYPAQIAFERDSFELALNNPGGGNSGFADLASKYSATAAGNSAKYYAGICCLNLGKFDEAVKYLNDYSAKGEILPIMKYSALGDAYSELNQLDKAVSAYKDAVDAGDSGAATPMMMKKLAMLQEKQGNKEAALKLYEGIKEKYSQSVEASDVDKYIIRAGGKTK